jgi:cell division protein FtsI/penicillin-binding protein 2
VPAVLFGVAALAVFARLVQVQVLEHDRYAAEAKAEQSATAVIPGRRGAILDRHGNVLASSIDTWDFYVSTYAWKEPERAVAASEELGAALRLDPAELRAAVAGKGTGDVRIAVDIEYELGKEIIALGIPGVVAVSNTSRVNPDGDIGASVIGYIGADNAGLAGVEASLNDTLQGKPGQAVYERDSEGDPIPFGNYLAVEPEPGKDVVLTIDRYLQRLAEQRLAEAITKHRAKGGSIIIMDPATAEILAMASSPGLTFSQLDRENPDLGLLRNRAVTDLYEPGSIMKVITAASAIDTGVVTPDTWYHDTGYYQIGDDVIRNWEENVYGDQTMTGVLQNSINTGSIFMVNKLGPELFHQYLDRFGFGRPTGVELDGEAGGIFRKPGEDGWTAVDLATQSFGQAISVTPLQLITAVSAVVNGGNLLKPTLVKAVVDASGNRTETPATVVDRAISPEASATMRTMLEAVINPGWPHKAKPADYTAGGKSATANVPVINGYDDTQIAAFVGFGPVEMPRLVVLVKLDENADFLTGTDAAGPVVASVLNEALHYMNVRPDDGRFVEAP